MYLYLPDSMGSVGLFSISFRFFCPRGILNEKRQGRVVRVSKMQYEFTRISQLSGTFTNGAQLTPKFISKRRQSFCMLKIFNEHNVRQHSPANISSYKRLATFASGFGRLSKRRSKRRSVNPA